MTAAFKTYAYSDGIGLHGERSTTYIVPVSSSKAFYRWRLSERLFLYGAYARLLTVQTLSQNDLAKRG